MKRLVIFLALAVFLSSCGGPKNLYYWGGDTLGTTKYETLAYKDYKTQTPEATCRLICVYDDMVNSPGGSRIVPPPGICAEYGYLLLLPETAATFLEHATKAQRKQFARTDYSVYFLELGQEMLKKEIEYYPESRQFIEPLIKKLAN